MTCKDILKYILFFLKVDDSILTFVSGIFVATSVNIYTSQLPKSVFELGIPFVFVGLNLLLIAFLLMRWSIIVKPALLDYDQGRSVRKKDNISNIQGWYDSLENVNINYKKILIIVVHIFILAAITTVLVLCGSSTAINLECICPECTQIGSI